MARDKHVFPDVLATVQESRWSERDEDPFLATDDYFNQPHHDHSSRIQQNQFGWLPHQRNPKPADGHECWICCFPQQQSQLVQKYSQLLGKVSFQFCLLLRVDWWSSSWLVWWRRNASNAKLRPRVQMQAQRKTSWFYIMGWFLHQRVSWWHSSSSISGRRFHCCECLWVGTISNLWSREKEGLLLDKASIVLVGLHPKHEWPCQAISW